MSSHSETGKSDLASVPLEWDLNAKNAAAEPESAEAVIELTETARAEVCRLMEEQQQAG